MDIRLLQTFLLVAKTENITQAAEQLYFSQPTVTAQIRTLEEDFGVLLFERVGKKLYITKAGLRLIGYAEKLLLLYGEAKASVQEFSNHKNIKIGLGTAVAAYTLSPILREFQGRVSNVSVSIEHCLDIPTAVKGILDNSFDLAIVHDNISNGRILQFDVVSEKLLWVAHANLLQTYNGNMWKIPFIALKQGSIYRTKYDPYLQEKTITPILEYSDSEAVRQAVLNGLGVGVLPEILVRSHVEDGTLHEFSDAPTLEIGFSVIFHKDKTFTLAMRTLLMLITEHATTHNGLSEYLLSCRFAD
jgi:DNA-binding transcriptional LysR family regulator